MGLLLIVVTFGLMYVLLIRPQQRRARAQAALTRAVAAGDEIMTTSGFYGVVTELEDDTLLLEISEGIEVRIARAAVARIVQRPGDDDAAEATDDDDDTADEADDDTVDDGDHAASDAPAGTADSDEAR